LENLKNQNLLFGVNEIKIGANQLKINQWLAKYILKFMDLRAFVNETVRSCEKQVESKSELFKKLKLFVKFMFEFQKTVNVFIFLFCKQLF
jgi:hypothetical protein